MIIEYQNDTLFITLNFLGSDEYDTFNLEINFSNIINFNWDYSILLTKNGNNYLTFSLIFITLFLYFFFLRYISKIKTIAAKLNENKKLGIIDATTEKNFKYVNELTAQILMFLIVVFFIHVQVISLNYENLYGILSIKYFNFLMLIITAIWYTWTILNKAINPFFNNIHFFVISIISLLLVTHIVTTVFTNLAHLLILIELFSYVSFAMFTLTKEKPNNLDITYNKEQKTESSFIKSSLQYIALNFITTLFLLIAIFLCYNASLSLSLITLIKDTALTKSYLTQTQHTTYTVMLVLFAVTTKLAVIPFQMYTQKMYRGFSILSLYLYTWSSVMLVLNLFFFCVTYTTDSNRSLIEFFGWTILFFIPFLINVIKTTDNLKELIAVSSTFNVTLIIYLTYLLND